MKLLTLDIKNIASLVEASIDFASPALTAEPIFLVTGKTGSGKTSILNCICIALFNQVPALDEAGRDEDNHGVRVGSPLQLVRRNCKEAYIKLTFSDKENTLYILEWSAARLSRGANKGEFGKQAIQRTLTILRADGTREHYGKLGEVAEQVEQALGLTFEQFCRTTMLAQGQFLKFINSDKKNKSEILEKITGTEIYSQVGRQIYAIAKDRKDKHNALYNQIAGAQLLTDDEKRQLTEQIQALASMIDAKSKALAEIETHERWLEATATTSADYAKAQGELATATTDDKKLAIKAMEDTVTRWEATADIRAIIADGLKADGEFAEANDAVAALRPAFTDIAHGLAHLRKSVEDCHRQIADNGEAIKREKPYEAVYAAEGQALALIDVIEDETEKIGQCQQRIADAQAGLQKAKGVLARENVAVSAAQTSLDEQQAVVDRLTKEGEGVDAKALNKSKTDAGKRLDFVGKAIDAHKALTDSETDYANKLAEIGKLNDSLATDRDTYAKAVTERDKRLAISNDAAARLRGQMDLSERLAELTRIFKDSHACPLCGSEVEHLHTKEIIDQAVGEAQAEADKAKSAYDDAVNAANDLAASVKSLSANLKKANGEADKLKSQTDKRHTEFEAYGIGADDLQSQRTECQSLYDQLSEALTKALDHASALKSATSERDRRRRMVEEAQSRRDAAKKEVDDIEAGINSDKASAASLSESKQANINKLNGLLAKAPHPELEGVDLNGIKTTLPRLKAHYDGLVARSAELAGELDKLQTIKQEVADKLALVESSFGAPDPEAEPREMADIAKQAANLSAETIRLCGQIEAINRRRKSLADNEEAYFTEHSKEETLADIERLEAETPETIADKRKQAADYAVGVANLQGRVEQLAARMAELADIRPASLPDELTLEQAVADKTAAKAEVDDLTQQKTKGASRLEQNEEREKALEQLRGECERAKKEYYKWESLNRALGAENGDRLRNLAQAYIFGALLRSANRFMSQLTDRYTLEGEVGSLVIYVIDHHDGGNKRVAKGLSGGEGFMASLALSLALSTINQELDPLDILFIDEGFGSLDPTAREFTIDMLCSLRRRVCVISHMPELRECIPTQIVVTRHPGSSRSEVQIGLTPNA